MKKHILIPAVFLGLMASAGAAVTWDIAIGALRSSNEIQVPENSLWAIIYTNGSGNLPGGLESNSSLTSGDASSILSAFAGKSIITGGTISGSTILLTGAVDAFGTASHSMPNAAFPPFPGVSAGGVWGLYWFPELTTTSYDLPTSDFQVGGFTQADESVEPYGNTGTVIPSDGSTATTTFFDNITTEDSGDLPVSRFTAVAVPEPATLALSALGLAALLRRRRN